jgi:hypothetical protein
MDGQPGIGLAEQAAFKSPPESPSAPVQQSSRLSIIAKTFDRRPSKESNTEAKHKSKGSIASSIGKALNRSENDRSVARSSQESQRNLYKAPTQETGSLTKSDYDWFAELDRDCVGKRTTTKIEKGENPFNTGRPLDR